jgi:para-aminobenzoate synthetase component II
MILLIDNYDSFTFNLYQLIETLGYTCLVVRNDAITCEEVAALHPAAIVLSPGPGHPDSAGITLEVIKAFKGLIPIFGVCLGHQAIGEAFGASIIRASKPRHGKPSTVTHNGSGIFQDIKSSFTASRYHSLVIDPKNLPDCLEVTAVTGDGMIMGIRHRDYAIEGVQFHPESIATDGGPQMMKTFLSGGITHANVS